MNDEKLDLEDSLPSWLKLTRTESTEAISYYRALVRNVTKFLVFLAMALSFTFFFHRNDPTWNFPWSLIGWIAFIGVNAAWTYSFRDMERYRRAEPFRTLLNVGFIILIFFLTGGSQNNFWFTTAFCIVGTLTSMYLLTGKFFWIVLVYPAVYQALLYLTGGEERYQVMVRAGTVFLFLLTISYLFFRMVRMIAVSEKRLAEEKANSENQRRRAEEAVAAIEAKNYFIANVNHELRTPLTVISGFAELLSTDGQDRESTKKYAEAIRRNADHLNGIVSDILDLSKIDSGELMIDRTDCHPAAEAARVMEMFSETARQNGNVLELTTGDDVPETVMADTRRVRQMLINLVGNANKFTANGKVTLVLEYRFMEGATGELVFTCIDTGIGIGPGQQDRIFEPFVQEDASTSRKHGGTGLGLFISRKLARLHGGDVTLVRSAPQEGSTFRLNLPVAVPEVRTELHLVRGGIEDGIQPTSEWSGLSGKKILIAEDNPDGQLLLKRRFEAIGADVTIVSDGAQAVEVSKGCTFHVAVLDLQMPVMSGYEACRQIRAQQPGLPILALTANATNEERSKAMSSGFSSFVTKPIAFEKLFSQITVLLKPAG